MNTRKALGMAVAVVLIVVSLLAGCTSAQPASPAASPAATTQPTVAQSTTAAVESSTPAEPAVDTSEFVELKYYDLGDKAPDTDRILGIINEKLKADLNCSVTYTTISWADFVAKYPLIFASGEDFDMVFTAYWCNYAQEAVKGAFAELTEASLQKYMPRTFAKVTQEQWAQTKVGGKIYMAPSTAPNYTNNSKSVFLVRGDLMKKYGISSIQTPQEMLAYWDAVAKDEESTGIVPIAVGNSSTGYWGSLLASEFTKDNDIGHTDNNHYDVGHVTTYFQVFDFTDPQNVKVVDNSAYDLSLFTLLREFNKNGYFGTDAATQTDENLTMFENGISATGFRQLGNVNSSWIKVQQAHPDWDPQMVDIRPDIPVWNDVVTSNGMAVHATAKNSERAMMVMDLLGYEPSYHDLCNGVEGKDYTVNADGSLHFAMDANGKQIYLGANGFMGFSNKFYNNETRAPNFDSLMDTYSKDNFTPALAAMNFDSSSVNTQIATVNAVESKYLPILRLGLTDDVKGTYDKMVAELKSAGLADIQAEYLKQAQVFMSTYDK